MKKLISFLTLIVLVNVAMGQNYIPLPLDSAVWRVDYNYTDAQGGCAQCTIPYQYITNGDTIIQSVTYTKIKETGFQTCGVYGCNAHRWNGYKGAIRQDTLGKKIFIIWANDTIEKTLYDFTQNVGATINSVLNGVCETRIIESIDSILIGTTYHKRFNTDFPCTSLIEGIGSTHGLLDPFCCFEWGSILNCVSHFNQTIYSNSGTSCAIVPDNINEISLIDATVSPNPFRESFEIKLPKPFENVELTIYDLLSRQQFKKKYTKIETIKVIRNDLTTGIYFYQLVSENKIISTGKIIAE